MRLAAGRTSGARPHAVAGFRFRRFTARVAGAARIRRPLGLDRCPHHARPPGRSNHGRAPRVVCLAFDAAALDPYVPSVHRENHVPPLGFTGNLNQLLHDEFDPGLAGWSQDYEVQFPFGARALANAAERACSVPPSTATSRTSRPSSS